MALQDPYDPDTVRNMDIVGLVERIDRYVFDMAEFESASLNEIISYDIERLEQYSRALRTYSSMISSASSMDLPHSYPHMYEIKYITKELNPDNVKNKAIRDLIRLYMNAWVQLSRSESADRSNGFMAADYDRFLLIMDRADQYLATYVQSVLPVDTPHSSSYETDQILGR